MQQRQVQTEQTIWETAEILQVQFLDRVVDMPVVVQRQFPWFKKAQKTLEVSQRGRLATWVRQLQQIIHGGHSGETRVGTFG